MTSSPTAEELQKLLDFNGWGNPGGDFWFVGMEERGDGTDLELRWWLGFEPIEDLIPAHLRWKQFNPDEPFNPSALIRTWATMSKIVLRLRGEEKWSETDQLRRYQAERLGRRGGETFLTELLPLPARSAQDWPYSVLWLTRAEYEREVRPKRIQVLRELHERHTPRYVFCYGKANWEHYQKIFPGDFEPVADGQAMLAQCRSSTVVLAPFFIYYAMTTELIDRIAAVIEARESST
jgi:hypothetical protein